MTPTAITHAASDDAARRDEPPSRADGRGHGAGEPNGRAAPNQPAPWRHPTLAAVVFATVVALLVSAVVFAFVAASGSEGATNAEGAVRDLFDAVEHNDVIGMVELLPPAERVAFREHLADINDDLQRLGLVSPLSLSSVPGYTVDFRDVHFHVAPLSNEVARVTALSGRVVLTPKPESFPLPIRTRDLLDRDLGAHVDPASGERVIDLGAWRPNVVAVRDSGGWHVSLFYSIAEAARGDDGGPTPRFNQGPAPAGAATAGEVVEELFRAAADLDPAAAVALVQPQEGRAVYDYATLFLPAMRRRAAAIEADEPFSLSVKRVDVAIDGEGSTRRVRVTGLEASLDDGDDHRSMFFDGSCLVVEHRRGNEPAPVPTTRTCDGDLGPAAPPEGSDRLDTITAWQGLGRAFPTFVVEERGGRWYLSPSRTLLTTLHEILHGLQTTQVDAFSARLGEIWRRYGLPTPHVDDASGG
jgi:hypothetical protein